MVHHNRRGMATLAMRAVGTPPLARARAEPISSRAARPRLRVRCLNRAGAKSFHTPPALHPRGWTSVARSTVAASDAKAEEEDGAGESAGAVKKYEGSAELATQLEAAGDAVAEYLNEALKTWEPPKFLWRTLYTLLLLGLVVKRVVWQRKLNMQQTLQPFLSRRKYQEDKLCTPASSPRCYRYPQGSTHSCGSYCWKTNPPVGGESKSTDNGEFK